MKTVLQEINVTLSKKQKEKIYQAFHNRENIRLRLSKDALNGSDTLLVPTESYEGLDDIPDGTDAIVDESTFDEMWKEFCIHHEDPFSDDMWESYGLFFYPAIDEIWEGEKGIDFALNYSLIYDSTKESVLRKTEKSVSRNIEKLMECGANCH